MKKSTPRLSHQPPNGIDSEEYESLAKLIEPYADGPFDKLPDGLRQCVIEAFDFESEPFDARQWDELTPSKRRSLARDYDADHDPTKKIEQVAGMHEVDYRPNHVQAWLTMGAVSPLEAALLFFGQNPSKFKSNPPDMGEDFDLMERSFEDAARDGQVRSLNDWLILARARDLNAVGLDGWEACATIAALTTDTATPAPVVTASASAGVEPATPNWKMQIQTEATALCLRLRKSGASPTKNSIHGSMATWCRDNNVKTDGKIFPSANYLRTHVLGGNHWELPN